MKTPYDKSSSLSEDIASKEKPLLRVRRIKTVRRYQTVSIQSKMLFHPHTIYKNKDIISNSLDIESLNSSFV